MILIVSNSHDVHARHIANLLQQRGSHVARVARADFGRRASISLAPDLKGGSLTINGVRVAAEEISAVWYRRPGRVEADAAINDSSDRSFTENEWAQILDGFFAVACRRNVSPPWRQRAATKPLQLSLASEVGLRVPKTLITSNPQDALAFVEEHRGNVVHKTLTSPAHIFSDTRPWRPADTEYLADLGLCPTIFQEQIVGPADVRATVVGDRIFSARIATEQTASCVDSRLSQAECTPHELPGDVQSAVLQLMDRLGLVFGTVDFKIAQDGDYVFLEINPQGQFLYIEILTGLPISDALADFLAMN